MQVELNNQKQASMSYNIAQDQIKVHSQTISILVSEKTELTAALQEARHTAKEKSGRLTNS